MGKIAVVTGPTGAIGVSLCKQLSSQGYIVYAIVRKDSVRVSALSNISNLKIIPCDLSEIENVYNYVTKADVFFHLGWAKTSVAGRDDYFCQLDNVKYTIDAVNLAVKLGCKSFVGAGSQAEYGVQNQPLNDKVLPNPTSGYGIAKLSSCYFAKSICNKNNIKFNWVRILSVFGEHDSKTSLISYLIISFLKGDTAELTLCEQDWDYMYSYDTAGAIIAVAESGVNDKIYALGSGKSKKLKEYVEIIKNKLNGKVEFGAKPYYPHQPMFLVADITDLTKDTGFIPKYSFEDGIDNTIKYVKENFL